MISLINVIGKDILAHESLLRSKNRLKSRRTLLALVASTSGAVAVGGCGGVAFGESAAAARVGMTVQQRIGFDYANWGAPDGDSFGGQDCLSDSPYDPSTAVITTQRGLGGRKVAVIIPKGYEDPNVDLRLVGFNKLTEDLQPEDNQSANILRIYGCKPSEQPHQ